MVCAHTCDELCENIGGNDLVPNYRKLYERADALAKKRKREEHETSTPVLLSRASLYAPQARQHISKDIEGQARLDIFYKFMQRVDERYMRRSLGQRDFHRSFLIACLPHVVGDLAWSKHRAYYLALFDEDTYKAEVLVTTPRRFGKTTAVAMFVAALMCCCPRMWVSIFSTGKRASKSLLVQIKEVISSVPTMEKRVISSNVEELWVQPVNTTTKKDQSRCYSYPSSVKGLKGVSAKVIVMEEASRLSTDVFYEVVVPLLGVNNTAVLGISTPLGEDNYYSSLTGLKDENNLPLFKSMSVELVCPVCKKKNQEQMSCVHRMDVLPPWKSQGRQEKVKRIMASVPELFMQEAMGIVVSSRHGVFAKTQSENFAEGLRGRTDLPPITVRREDPIFICVDPTGGGSSKLALVAVAVVNGTYITVSDAMLIPKPLYARRPLDYKVVDVGDLAVGADKVIPQRHVQLLHLSHAPLARVRGHGLPQARQAHNGEEDNVVFGHDVVRAREFQEARVAHGVQVEHLERFDNFCYKRVSGICTAQRCSETVHLIVTIAHLCRFQWKIL